MGKVFKLDKKFLEIEYIKKQKTLRQIAKDTGYCRVTLSKFCKKYGIQLRPSRYKYIDITGQKFGHLTAIKDLGSNNNTRTSHRWECQCDCGKTKIIEIGRLLKNCKRKKQSISCGECKLFHGIPYSIWIKSKYTARHEWKVSDEYLWNLLEQQQHKCSLTGIDLYFAKSHNKLEKKKHNASLDRIDSNQAYIEGNVQWVDKDVNMMKQKYSQTKFIETCKAVYLWCQNKEF